MFKQHVPNYVDTSLKIVDGANTLARQCALDVVRGKCNVDLS